MAHKDFNAGARIERAAVRRMLKGLIAPYANETNLYADGYRDAIAQIRARLIIRVQLEAKRAGGFGRK